MRVISIDRFFGALGVVLAVVLFSGAMSFPERAQTSAVYIKFLSVSLFILSVLLFIQTRIRSDHKTVTWFKALKPFICLLVSTLVYISLIDVLSFYLASFLYMITSAWLLGFKKKITLFVTTMVLLIFVYVVFVHFLSVPISLGLFERFFA